MAKTIENVEMLLGGRRIFGRRVRDEIDLAEVVRAGFPKSVAQAITQDERVLTRQELYRFIPRRTLEHREQKHARLTAEQSDRPARIVQLAALAGNVLGTREKAQVWLRRPTKPLGGRTPLDLLDSDAGAKAAEELLDRIEHGIAA